ncbi:MAG: hypothetical protein GX431_13900 [Bacteroidales bacterium]|jgi:hypothetical protein|nr:hypothetical protein [Bacteroidales bacterium]
MSVSNHNYREKLLEAIIHFPPVISGCPHWGWAPAGSFFPFKETGKGLSLKEEND